MMAAPPPAMTMANRSPFSLGIASEKSRNGSTVPASVSVGDSVDLNANKGSKGKSFGDDDGQQQLDGSLRMSSASTDTTAATTLLLEENSVEDGRVTPPRHALTDAADQKHNLSPQGLQVEVSPQVKAKEVLEIQAGVVPSILQLPPELRDSSRSLNSSRRSRSSRTSAASASGKSKDKQTATLKQPPASASASASVHRELKQPPVAATDMPASMSELSPVQVVTLDYHDSCSSNMSMAADLVLGTSPASPIVVPSVARMPNQNEPEIDPQVLKFVQQLDEAETRKADPLSASDHEKKPPAKETPPTRHGNRKMPARPSLVLANKGRRSPSRSPRPSVTFAALPPETGMIPSLDLDDENDNNTSLQDQSNKPAAKPDTTGNGVPPAIAKPNPSRTCSDPTGSVVPQPRGRGLRGRRQPQTAQDRDNRRRQILERTANNNHNNQQQPPMMSNSDHSIPNSSISSGNSPMPTRTVLLEPGLSPATRTNNGSPTRSPATPSSNGTMTRDRPGDSLSLPLQPSTTYSAAAVVPGDNLAAFPAANRPTTRRVVRPLTPHQENKVANPSPNAYAAASPDANDAASVGTACTDLSSKQRARREQQGNMPASIRPGAYKEIPGRGLVRNDTLRFSIMSTIQRQKRSLRRMFSSRRNTIATSSRSNNLMDASNQTDSGMRRGNNSARITSNENNSDPNMLATSDSNIGGEASYASLFQRSNSMRSIPSVLVSDEGGHDSRSYLGNISFQSLTDAQEGGLTVARPVFHREPSTMEALCIIPGDLAMAVALDEQIKEAEQSNAEARLEALSSGAAFVAVQKKRPSTTTNAMAPPSSGGKRTKARRMVQQVVEKPKQLAKSVLKLNPKKLKNPFRRNKIKRSRTSGGANSTEMTDMRMLASEMSVGGGGAVRRHSF